MGGPLVLDYPVSARSDVDRLLTESALAAVLGARRPALDHSRWCSVACLHVCRSISSPLEALFFFVNDYCAGV